MSSHQHATMLGRTHHCALNDQTGCQIIFKGEIPIPPCMLSISHDVADIPFLIYKSIITCIWIESNSLLNISQYGQKEVTEIWT